MDVGFALALAGDVEQAEHELRRGHDLLTTIGDTGARCTVDAMLADVLRSRGRLDEAVRFAEESRAIAAPDDLDAQPRWRAALARVLASQGLHERALQLAREAVALVEPIDLLPLKAVVYDSLGAVQASAGRIDEAAAAVEQAIGAPRAEGKRRLGSRARAPCWTSFAAHGPRRLSSWRLARTAGARTRTRRASAARAERRWRAEPAREQRKVVTVLFCDLVGRRRSASPPTRRRCGRGCAATSRIFA